MMRTTLLLLTALLLVGVPGKAAGQADWTFRVPLQITKLPPEIEEGVVLCAVGPAAFPGSFPEEIHDLNEVQNAFGVGPGDPIPEWPGLSSTSYVGTFLGFQTFVPDASGNAPSSVQVGIVAPDFATDGSKSGAGYWACTVGLRLGTGWFASHPTFVMDDPIVEASVPPAEGTPHVLVVSGTISRN